MLFKSRRAEGLHSEAVITGEDQHLMLLKISNIFSKHKTNVKIVVSPLYDEIKLNPKDLDILSFYFGEKNIYDFSGPSHFSSNIGNYYENSHYRTTVGREILNAIYEEQNN